MCAESHGEARRTRTNFRGSWGHPRPEGPILGPIWGPAGGVSPTPPSDTPIIPDLR